jgi:hypothetical protein
MKKTLIVLLIMTILASFAVAQVTATIGGSSTLEWGLKGNLMNSTDAAATYNDFYTDDSGKFHWVPKDLMLNLEVKDGDLIIVKAQSKLDFKNKGIVFQGNHGDDNVYADAFEYIDFPNVVPGVLAIKLLKADKIGTGLTGDAKTVTNEPRIMATYTGVENLSVKATLNADLDNQMKDAALADAGNLSYVGLGVEGSYKVMLGEADSLKVSLGLVYDTQWGKSITGNSTDAVEETTADNYAGLPVGLGVNAVVAGTTIDAKFAMRMAGAGKPYMDYATGDTTASAPMFASIDVKYPIAGDVKITPKAGFKYSSDAAAVTGTASKYDYTGALYEADVFGRPMSATVGVDVTGIAAMLDLSITGKFGFGDWDTYLADSIEAGVHPYTSAAVNTDVVKSATASAIMVKATLKPMAKWTIVETITANQDDLGFLSTKFADYSDSNPFFTNSTDVANLAQDYTQRIESKTYVTYDILAGETVAAMFFGEATYRMDTGKGFAQYTVVGEVDPALTKTTLDYKLGVKCTVKF